MKNKEKIRELNNSITRAKVLSEELPDFLSTANKFYELVFSEDFQKRPKEYYSLKGSLFTKAVRINFAVQSLIPYTVFLVRLWELDVKFKSKKMAEKILKRLDNLLGLYIKMHEVISKTAFAEYIFAPSYGETYASPPIIKRRMKIIEQLKKMVQKLNETVQVICEDLNECLKIFISDAIRARSKLYSIQRY